MSRPIRIAFLSEHASPLALLGGADAGGQNVYVDEVSRSLGRLGFAVDVFSRRDTQAAPEVVQWSETVRVVNLTAGPAQQLPKDELWPLMPAFRQALLRFMLRDGARYDVLHGHFWMSGWVACALRRRLDIPVVQLFHALGTTKRRHQGDADTSPAARIAVEREVVQQADRLIAQCPRECEELLNDYTAAGHKIALIPPGVNQEIFYPVAQAEARRRIGLHGDAPTVVYVGRLLPRKDVRNVLRALAALKTNYGMHARLLIAGGETADPDPLATPEIGVLQQLAVELDVACQVTFYGRRQPDVLRYFYCAGDLAVTTPWYEPFGLTPLEAHACGRPVIGAAVGGLTYSIQDGITGLLVPPRDPERLAAALYRLLTHPEHCRAMGAAARLRVNHEFNWTTVARRTADLYATLLEQWHSSAPGPTQLARRAGKTRILQGDQP